MTNRMKNNYISELGQRHHEYLRKNKRDFLCGFQLIREIYNHLANIDYQAEEVFSQPVKQLVENEGVAERLKADNQIEWMQRMNSIRNRATENVNAGIIYTA